MAGKKVGVLAMQGAFREHELALKKCGAHPVQVRKVQELNEVEGLIIPGGESTTIGKMIKEYGLMEKIINRAQECMPIWGTCAGMILLAKEIVDSDQPRLGLMDILVKRNAYGRQVDSFEANLLIEEIGITEGIFIRAPYVEKIWGEVKVMCKHEDKIVMVKQASHLLATAFHPELTRTMNIHKYFLEMI